MPSSHRGLPVEAAAPIIAKSSCQELILPWQWKLSSLASFKKKLSLGAILQVLCVDVEGMHHLHSCSENGQCVSA